MRIGRLFAMMVLTAAVWPLSVHSAPVPESAFAYNRWSGMAYTDDKTGRFSHCAVASTYTNGVTLMFGVLPGGNVNIGFTRPDWTFKVGQTIPGEIRIDRRFSEHVLGTAYLPNAILVAFPPSATIFAHLAHGDAMTVSTDAGASGTFNLKDSYRALEMAFILTAS